MSQPEIEKFLKSPLKVVNVGLEAFARDLERQGGEVIDVDWRPPAGGSTSC